jgi:hypothetical protein
MAAPHRKVEISMLSRRDWQSMANRKGHSTGTTIRRKRRAGSILNSSIALAMAASLSGAS